MSREGDCGGSKGDVLRDGVQRSGLYGGSIKAVSRDAECSGSGGAVLRVDVCASGVCSSSG